MMVDNGMGKDGVSRKVERVQIAIKYCLRETRHMCIGGRVLWGAG